MSQTCTIHVNGDKRSVEVGTTLIQLLDSLGLNRDGVAVALDRRVVPRSEHRSCEIPPGAMVEVIRAVGGG